MCCKYITPIFVGVPPHHYFCALSSIFILSGKALLLGSLRSNAFHEWVTTQNLNNYPLLMGRQCTVQVFSCLGNECNPFTKHTAMDAWEGQSVSKITSKKIFCLCFSLDCISAAASCVPTIRITVISR